jgi:ABC-type Fe3+/spermidine/putrescine transport system ATPase subunit
VRADGAAATLVLDGLTREFGSGGGVRDLSLELSAGGTLALLGPSGSGKTTTLRLLAGFETPDRGRVLAGGEDVTRLGPVARRFGMVFQHYALFPHLDVGRNVAFGLEGRGLDGAGVRRRVAEALEAVDLAGFEGRSVASLSGGQQQRVALARAVAPEPRVLLLDEPLSNLDPALRERTRRELRMLIERIGITTVLVTHEQEEAFDLAERVAVLNGGRLEQVGTPEELYDEPATPFVAGFVGRSTSLVVEVVAAGPRARVRLPGGGEVTLPIPAPAAGPYTLCLRPEAVRFEPASGPGATVVHRRFRGASVLYTVAWDGVSVEVLGRAGEAVVGEAVGLTIAPDGVFLFPAGRP